MCEHFFFNHVHFSERRFNIMWLLSFFNVFSHILFFNGRLPVSLCVFNDFFFRWFLESTKVSKSGIKHIPNAGIFLLFFCLFSRCFLSRHRLRPTWATWRGLNSGSVTDVLLRPAWCRGYHAGLSFLRPEFNSRSGRLISSFLC